MKAPQPSNKLRWVLLGVGGTLLALLLWSGLEAVRLLGELHTKQQAVTHALAVRTQMLSGLWLSIQNYNKAVQQFVVGTKADRARMTRQHLDRLTLEIDEDLVRYPSDRDATETAMLEGMQDVFSQQRTIYISVLASKPDQHRGTEASISERMVSLEHQMLALSDMLRAWSGQRLRQADGLLAKEFGALQGGLSKILAISFGSGLLLIMGSMAYIVRLERQTYNRYMEAERSQHELQRLSARLLDAQETERRSISRELHDEIGQALGALLVDIGRLSNTVSQERPEEKAQLDHMKSVAELTVQAIRNIALLLRPSMLDDLGLVAALEWQGREVSRRSEMEVLVESDDIPEDLPDDYRICIYRIVQEALHNAVRHSGARNATVTVDRLAKSIGVRVRDDGRGFDPQRTRGLGILGMEERVKRLGGRFSVESAPGQGTTVEADLPFPPVGQDL